MRISIQYDQMKQNYDFYNCLETHTLYYNNVLLKRVEEYKEEQ